MEGADDERPSQDECFVRSVNPMMSPFGTKRKCSLKAQMSVVGGRTDMVGNRRTSEIDPTRTSSSLEISAEKLSFLCDPTVN